MTQSNHLARMQPYWDWRAAGNFMCGGAGAGLVAFAGIHGTGSPGVVALLVAGLALVGLGLLCVWLEIGRPWRAMNVFAHLGRSWMSREALAAAVLFLLGAAFVFGLTRHAWPAALAALAFIYCQARIVAAARGIPAWRLRSTATLLVLTALAEGAGLYGAAAALVAPSAAMGVLMAVLIAARALVFEAWAIRVGREAGPIAARWAARMRRPARVIAAAVPLAALAAAAIPSAAAPWLAAAAGALVVATGAAFKFILITRMGQYHGFSLPRMPVRGAPRVAPTP